MAKLVVYAKVEKRGVTQSKKLFGHALALPLSDVDIEESRCDELPRKEFVKYAARVVFIGENGKAYKACRELTRQHGRDVINVEKLKRWFEFMGKERELERLERHEAEYTESWRRELDVLDEMTAFGDTATFSDLNKSASSDVASAMPQVLEDDDATCHEATGGLQNLVLSPTSQPQELSRRTRLQLIQELLKANDRVETDTEDNDEPEEELPDMVLKPRVSHTLLNEFEVPDQIIYDAFHYNGSHRARTRSVV